MQKPLKRRYLSNQNQITFGAAVQTCIFEFETIAPTKILEFGMLTVTTGVPNSPPLAAWLTSINIILNQTENVVPPMTRADYVNLVQNLESKEADLLVGTGNMLYKFFNPPLPAKTKVQITLGVNTLLLAFGAGAVTAIGTPVCYAYDSLVAGERRATYYTPINNFPQPAGVTANTQISLNLGTFARLEKAICLISEDPLGTAVDTYLGLVEMQSDGNPINFANAPDLKKQYLVASDGIAVPAGWHNVIIPEGGFNAASQNQLTLLVTPYLTTATGIIRGYEIFEKAY